MKKELLKAMIDEKLVLVQKHPEAGLFIYNYAARVQYEKLWNEVTLKTRGLILDGEMNLVARPFEKFFNLDEHLPGDIPQLPFDVYEKLDGSLGILYWHNGQPFIASRGSFTSDQAKHATRILHNKYARTFDKLDRTATYVFEIIYPQNMIVIDYGAMDDLILLAVIDNETGDERMEDIGFPMVKNFDGINNLQELRALEEANKEGFVVRFKNGFRVKVKFSEYVRLHRVITGVSNVAIWEHLAEGKSLDDLLEKVPDEFYNWVRQTEGEMLKQFDEIVADCKTFFRELETRKETALYFQTQKYPPVLFLMLDGKPYDKAIWKMIRPQYSRPFKTDEG